MPQRTFRVLDRLRDITKQGTWWADACGFHLHFRLSFVGRLIILEARSVIDRIEQESHKDPNLIDRFPNHLPGLFFRFLVNDGYCRIGSR